MDSPPIDGALALTPGHFLTGRPLQAIPSRIDIQPSPSLTKRWNLCQHLSREFCLWSRDYIRTLNRYQKWAKPKEMSALETRPGQRPGMLHSFVAPRSSYRNSSGTRWTNKSGYPPDRKKKLSKANSPASHPTTRRRRAQALPGEDGQA